jgi:hypothetical protein
MFKTVAVAAFLVSVMGCNKYMIKTGAGGNTSAAPKKSEWQMHFIDGLIGEGNFDVQEICGGPDATIKIERAILEMLPEVVEIVMAKAFTHSRSFRDLLEVAVDEAVREQLPGIARRVIRERLAEIEAAGEDPG